VTGALERATGVVEGPTAAPSPAAAPHHLPLAPPDVAPPVTIDDVPPWLAAARSAARSAERELTPRPTPEATIAPVAPAIPAAPAASVPAGISPVPAPPPVSAGPPAAPRPAASPPRDVAGAYLPPSAMFAVAEDPATGRARVTQAIPPGRTSTAVDADSRGAGRPTSSAGQLDLRLDAPDDLAGWLVAIGAAVAAVGFVLPWADLGLIGGGLDAGFFSRWGLANAANVVPFLATLGTVWFAIAPSVRHTAARTAGIGLVLGASLLGLVFVYATSPFGLGRGGAGVGAGAVVVLAGGLVALRRRHATSEPAV
jgi:hypothetical protein